MAITKKEFKALMKECLEEIIVEMIKQGTLTEAIQKAGIVIGKDNNGGKDNNLTVNDLRQKATTLNEDVDYKKFAKSVAAQTANGIVNENLRTKYQAIFEDTMLHTMPMQNSSLNEAAIAAEAGKDALKLTSALGQTGADPSKWAKLAFANTNNGKNTLNKRMPGEEDLG